MVKQAIFVFAMELFVPVHGFDRALRIVSHHYCYPIFYMYLPYLQTQYLLLVLPKILIVL